MTDKHEPADSHREPETMDNATEEQDLQSRREFLIGLGKWSRVVIAGAVFGGAMLTQKTAEAGWINRRGVAGAAAGSTGAAKAAAGPIAAAAAMAEAGSTVADRPQSNTDVPPAAPR